jgi:addiction module RelE/StbE family toxin
MEIIFHKTFEKQFLKLVPKDKEKVSKTLEIFIKNPFDKKLRNHALSGLLKNQRSIYVKSDLRIIFEEKEKYSLVIFLDLGTHSRVY